jgi:hypothetical protein
LVNARAQNKNRQKDWPKYFYRIEKEQNIKYPRTNYIVGIMMVYRIKLYNKKSTQEDDIDMYNNQN